MTELEVTVPAAAAGSYKVQIGTGLTSSLWGELNGRFSGSSKFIVTDSNLVAAGHLKNLVGSNDIPTFIIDPPGEISKHINTVVGIVEEMEKAKLGRDSVIIALGGGTVGDIAGFAAAIFKRGVRIVQIPTTTVAQADSSIGGKTGVDSSISKNAFGAFWHPDAVYIDVSTLKTLDEIQYRAGLVESVKHALIAEAEYFDFFETNMDRILSGDLATLEQIACRNCRIKTAVVEEDPTEKNKRRILNYGHTVGHAVESASGYDLLHGQGVAIGIIAAQLIEKEMNLLNDDRFERTVNLLKRLKMPLKVPKHLKKDVLIDIIRHDKKAVGKWPRFVLLERIGKPLCKDGQWAHDVPKEVVEEILEKLY